MTASSPPASLDIIRCTHCHAPTSALSISEDKPVLECSACHQTFPRRNNIVFMVTKERDQDTLEKFEHQWSVWGADPVVFGRTSHQHEDEFFRLYADPRMRPAWFDGKRVLDAGCGHGIMVEVFNRLGARAVGLDLGDGIFQAAKRLDGKDVTLVQGDILDIPFHAGTFDYVYCHGVAHHTRDPRQAFHNLASLVKKGGSLGVWLYPKKGWLWEVSMATGRAVTTRLPPAVLSKLVYLLVPLLYVVPSFSGTSPRKNTLRQCAQVIYDWLSPKYQSHHTFEEVKRWYEEEGFENIGENLHIPLSMYGTKK